MPCKRASAPRSPIARRHYRLLVSGAGFWLSLALSTAQAADGLTVTGDVKHALTLDVAALRAFPTAAHTAYRYARREVSDQQRPFTELRGVRLMDVLAQAGLAERDRSDWRKAVVIAIGRDGSRTVFSWPELAYTSAGTEAMVAYERDVAPLPATDGPLAIHVPGDERRVARDVKQLQRIEVRILRD
jgi:DMSO/TMAO reductase YedYZ molybdopterin-dependent catalytic subunit